METKITLNLQNLLEFIWSLVCFNSVKLFVLFFSFYFLFFPNNSFSQNVGIGMTSFTPDPSAMLEVNSTNKGTLVTRMTTAQMNAIPSPATGLFIYNTDCNTFNYYNGTTWIALGNTGSVSTPGAIIGNTIPCQNATGITYSIAAVSGATGYSWIVPAGATIATGQGTTNITVNFGINNGNVGVTAYNACSISTASYITITLSPVPSAAGSISGTTTVCQSQNGVAYSVGSISGATGYVWTYTGSGFSIATGSNTNSITANFSSGATAGSLTVYGTHTCGNGTPSSAYAITVNSLPTTASAGSDINPSCGVTTATLAGNTPTVGTGAWSVVSGTATITDPSSPTSGVTGLTLPGSATLRWTISNSTCTPSIDDLVISTNTCCTPGTVVEGTLTRTTTCGAYTLVSWTGHGSTTWTVPNGVTSIACLVVAGGGSGTSTYYGGGGGGAGGLVYASSKQVSGTISLSVGNGGVGCVYYCGSNGENSIFGDITAIGGGSCPGVKDGGSGAGAYCEGGYQNIPGGAGTQGNSGGGTGYGHAGGGNAVCNAGFAAAGGGGAGAIGNLNTVNNANGGAGMDFSSIFGTSVGVNGWFAGGGAGGGGTAGTAYSGGAGGGGSSTTGAPDSSTHGVNGTGGGGGCSYRAYASGNGGSGAVVIKY